MNFINFLRFRPFITRVGKGIFRANMNVGECAQKTLKAGYSSERVISLELKMVIEPGAFVRKILIRFCPEM